MMYPSNRSDSLKQTRTVGHRTRLPSVRDLVLLALVALVCICAGPSFWGVSDRIVNVTPLPTPTPIVLPALTSAIALSRKPVAMIQNLAGAGIATAITPFKSQTASLMSTYTFIPQTSAATNWKMVTTL